jgi:hypothetical protein
VMAQGRSYLATALAISDSGLRSAALQQALGHSKEERDVETFLKTAQTMAKTEKDPKKRSDIWNSMGDEVLGITRFYQAMDFFNHVANDASFTPQVRQAAFEKSVKIASMLHDPTTVLKLLRQPMANSIPSQTRSSAEEQLLGMVEASVQLPEPIQQYIVNSATDDKKLLSLYKSQNRLSPAVRASLGAKLSPRCRENAAAAVCKWSRWPEMNTKIASFQAQMSKLAPTMQAIEPGASQMSGMLDLTKTFQGSGEPQLDILVVLGNVQIYNAFASFLMRAADANKEVAQILKSKATESLTAAKASQESCGKIVQAGNLDPGKFGRLCSTRGLASVGQTLDEPAKVQMIPPTRDPGDSDVVEQQKNLFAKRDEWKAYYALGESYLNHKEWNHAAATATMARAAFPQAEEEFNGLLGCALVNTGLVGEAQFVLNKASDMNGHKTACLGQAKSR